VAAIVLQSSDRLQGYTGQDPVSAIRYRQPSELLSKRDQQLDKPSRSEAIRQLVEFALKANQNGKAPAARNNHLYARITKRTQFSAGARPLSQ
jgi:hypothetical protein